MHWEHCSPHVAFTACCSGARVSHSHGASNSTCLISLHLCFVLNVKGHKLQQISAACYLHFTWSNAVTGADWCCGETGAAAHKTNKYGSFSICYYWKVKSVGILLLSLKRKIKAVFSYQRADFLVIICLRSPHSSFAVKVKAPHCDYDRFDSDGCRITVKQITVEENTRLNRDLLGSLICCIAVLVCNWLHYCSGCVLITLFNPASRLTENTVWRFSCLWIRSCVLLTYEDISLRCTYLFQEQTHLPSISWSWLWPGTV